MQRVLLLTTILSLAGLPLNSQTEQKPSFNGTWILGGSASREIYTVQHDDTHFHLIQRIEDGLGKRTVDVSGMIDGRPHRQKVDEDDIMLRAQWFGDSLIFETRRDRASAIFYNRRIMRMVGHDEIRALRTRFLPGPEQSWDEVWLRQSEK